MKTLNYPRVIEWARQRGILDQSTAQFQMLKATEEHGEMAGAILRGDRDELIDSIGDQLVVAIVQCAQLGYDVAELLPTIPFNCRRELDDVNMLRAALDVTEAQGGVSGAIARSKDSSVHFLALFTHIFYLCHVRHINPAEALDSVYDIISKRGGEMRNGVWVKTEDL